MVFWKVTPCSLLDIDPPPTKRWYTSKPHVVTSQKTASSTAFSFGQTPNAKQATDLLSQIKDNQSRPSFHISSSQFTLSVHFAQTSRDVNYSLSYHCFINSFKESRCCYFPNIYIYTHVLINYKFSRAFPALLQHKTSVQCFHLNQFISPGHIAHPSTSNAKTSLL